MTTVHFENLSWLCWFRLTGWLIGIIRVYDGGKCYPAPYKFFTVATIYKRTATITGLINAHITKHYLKIIAAKLAEFGVHEVRWIHNHKLHFLRL